MLVLSRRIGEEIVIADNIRVRVLSVQGNQVRLGFVAPREVQIHRAELLGREARPPLPQPDAIIRADPEAPRG